VRLFQSVCRALLSTLLLSSILFSQDFGPPRKDPNLPTVSMPTAFPLPGTYATTNSVSLFCGTPGAEIHYTLDGTRPGASSPLFDPYKLLVVGAVNNGEIGLKTGYTIRAVGIKTGMNTSDVATFQYTIDRRNTTAYLSEEIVPGVTMIRDYAEGKMYLIKGSKKALLIDTGMGTGNLKAYLEPLVAGVPLEIVITHFHGDHTGQCDQFISSSIEFINESDRSQVAGQLKQKGVREELIQRNLRNIKEGDILDLGDKKLTVYLVPGHTRGSIVLFDETTGYLISGDALGSNGPGIPDAIWLQFPGSPPLDLFLSSIEVFRSKLPRKISYMLTGHNDRPLQGEGYLDNLQLAAQSVVDAGTKVLVPSVRPPNGWQVLIGDRTRDPNWVSINVNKENCLSTTPATMATLSNLQLKPGLALDFIPSRFDYTTKVQKNVEKVQITPTTTATPYSQLKINDMNSKSRVPYDVPLKIGPNRISITVTAPDGVTAKTYTLVVNREDH
jgi:glyoxylase-like metal-dependent hydrolase (beta-lactamase superfamily II)